jgi:hypothetical protein
VTDADTIRILEELIAALDLRVPRMTHAGEASIARDAAALKKSALKRIAQLRLDATPEDARPLPF